MQYDIDWFCLLICTLHKLSIPLTDSSSDSCVGGLWFASISQVNTMHSYTLCCQSFFSEVCARVIVSMSASQIT